MVVWLAVTLGVEDSVTLTELEQSQGLALDLPELSATRATVRAVLAGGEARKAHENAEKNEYKATQLAADAKSSELKAKKSVATAAYKKVKASKANLAEVAQSAAAMLRSAKTKAEQSMREANEAGIKHVLLAKLRNEQLQAVTEGQKYVLQHKVIETQVNDLESKAKTATDHDNKTGKKSASLQAQRSRTQRSVWRSNSQGRAKVNAARRNSRTESIAKAKVAGAKQANVPEAMNQGTETKIPRLIANKDVWGAKKCAIWISKDPAKCRAPNYQFNCAKTCTQQRRMKNLVPNAKASLKRQYARAQAATKASNKAITQHKPEVKALKQKLAHVKEAVKQKQQEKVVSLVEEKKSKAAVKDGYAKMAEEGRKVTRAQQLVANIGTNMRLVQDAIDTATAGLNKRFSIMAAEHKKVAMESMLQKGENVGLLMPGTKQTQEPQLKESFDKQNDKGLVWGDKNCNKWTKKNPSRCDAPNYKMKCAKSCDDVQKAIVAKNQAAVNSKSNESKTNTQGKGKPNPSRAKTNAKNKEVESLLPDSPASGSAARKELAAKTSKKKEEEQKAKPVPQSAVAKSPYEASVAQLQQKLYVEDAWGEKQCAKWVQAHPKRCSSPNYKVRCAKSCRVHEQFVAAREEAQARSSYDGALKAIENKVAANMKVDKRTNVNPILQRVNKLMQEVSGSIADALKSTKVHSSQSAGFTAQKAIVEEKSAVQAAQTARKEVRKASFDARQAKEAHLQAVKFQQDSRAVTDEVRSYNQDAKERSKSSMQEYQAVHEEISKVLAVPAGVKVSPLTIDTSQLVSP